MKKLEDLPGVLKQHNISYPKSWDVIFLKKRTARNSTLWKNWRFVFYARHRIATTMEDLFTRRDLHYVLGDWTKLFKKDFFKYQKIDVVKEKNKKVYAVIYEIKNGKIFNKKKVHLKPRKFQIKQCVSKKIYWDTKHFYDNKMPVEDMNVPNQVKIEVHDFYRSVCNYIHKKPYTRDFFIKALYTNSQKRYAIGELFNKSKDFWNFWKKIR